MNTIKDLRLSKWISLRKLAKDFKFKHKVVQEVYWPLSYTTLHRIEQGAKNTDKELLKALIEHLEWIR